MNVLRGHASKRGLSLESILVEVPLFGQGGIRSAELVSFGSEKCIGPCH